MRSQEPVKRVRTIGGGTAWLVTRHEDVRRVLSDPRMSSDRTMPGFPSLVPGRRAIVAENKQAMIGMDGQEHAEARRAVIGEFTVRRINRMRPRIQEIVDECVDRMLAAGGPVDLVRELSLPVPSLVICELLGVPYSDHDFFQSRSALMISRSTPPERRRDVVLELRRYLDELVAEKVREPADDLLGRQVAQQSEKGEVDREGLVSLAFLLLIAGHETTANMISLGTLALLDNPDQLARITEDPARTPAAVEELLRYFSIVDGATSRTALADIEIGGVLIREGEGVVAVGLSANRDPEAFDSPDELDLDRQARNHVAFGFGAHQCLGQNLARVELQIVFDTLFRRIPGLRLADGLDGIRFKDDALVYGAHEMSVTW
ncbi:cytochrome P450 hydroxylase [Saccharopolyspora erythraea NRRL 2338]|uniref:Cytochrome P450 hydroxylase n=1 Tax=Saccharopolyspora erythraea (strain ATCC 11635 / DSM 40517 / JCM 4748 / NBRC 13426 / NCIMB 8594 / NRRL 2338) TaxID=405948 RepID=A4FF79_SACEN|nr:cytochrome P450 hydroxylase [Saccharopolyspora erythraea NRRL 2338]